LAFCQFEGRAYLELLGAVIVSAMLGEMVDTVKCGFTQGLESRWDVAGFPHSWFFPPRDLGPASRRRGH
jgi:hypothetical protein